MFQNNKKLQFFTKCKKLAANYNFCAITVITHMFVNQICIFLNLKVKSKVILTIIELLNETFVKFG